MSNVDEIILSGALSACLHCGQTVPKWRQDFCCNGCQVVFSLLKEAGLEKFYQLRPTRIQPLLGYFTRQTDFSWVDQLPGLLEGAVVMDVEGIQCSACIWAISELARRIGPAKVTVDASVGKMRVEFVPDRFDIKAYLQKLQNLGYRTGTATVKSHGQSDSLLIRLGVCLMVAMNTMFLAISLYAGLNQSDPELFDLFGKLNFYLSFVSVLVGGTYFFNRAFYALKNRVLHFDLPVAIGIAAAFAGSTQAYLNHNDRGTYFDTLNIFIALMLLGRYLQAKALQKNREMLLHKGNLENFSVTRVSPVLTEIEFSQVKEGDELLIQPGGIVPVESLLESSQPVECSLEWISGESAPVIFTPGQTLPAGSCVLSSEAVLISAQAAFKSGTLAHLKPKSVAENALPVAWAWTTKWYVTTVLSLAFLGLLAWHFIDPPKAISVFVAVLVVTCPCSLGIAIPLARTLAGKALMQHGIFARNAMLLDRIQSVEKIFLDKTGTLTLSSLRLDNSEILAELKKEDLIILINAVARSRHPASMALYEALRSQNLPWIDLSVVEQPGVGLNISNAADVYFVGRRQVPDGSAYEVEFSKNGSVLAHFYLSEVVLDDAKTVVAGLQRQKKLVYVLSGDKKNRVLDLAQLLHLPEGQAFHDCRPETKAEIITRLSQGDSLMLGDGLNDAPAFDQALVCGVPVWERSIMSGRADFFFTAGHLRWLPQLFFISKRLKSTINGNLLFSAVYNLGTVSLSLAGLMSPLLCAILMPVGSLAIISWTSMRLKRCF